MEALDKCGIYCITCVANGKRYVGMTRQSFKRRWSQHISHLDAGRGSRKLQSDYNTYGYYGFKFDILEVIDCIKPNAYWDIDIAEGQWITKLNTTNEKYGYNLTTGGMYGIRTDILNFPEDYIDQSVG